MEGGGKCTLSTVSFPGQRPFFSSVICSSCSVICSDVRDNRILYRIMLAVDVRVQEEFPVYCIKFTNNYIFS